MTLDLYRHLYDGDLDSVAERLDTARAKFLRTSCGLSADNGATVVKLG